MRQCANWTKPLQPGIIPPRNGCEVERGYLIRIIANMETKIPNNKYVVGIIHFSCTLVINSKTQSNNQCIGSVKVD